MNKKFCAPLNRYVSCTNLTVDQITCIINQILASKTTTTLSSVTDCLLVTVTGAWGEAGDIIQHIRWFDTAQTPPTSFIDTYINTVTNEAVVGLDATNSVACQETSTVGGADTEVQFNNMGTFDGDPAFNWDNTNKRVGLGKANPDGRLDIAYGNLFISYVLPPDAPTLALAGLGAGNVTNGVHYYKITYLTADGKETELGYNIPPDVSINVVNNAADGQVLLSNISIAPAEYDVVARKIYRTWAGDTVYYYLIGTINNNTDTTFIDNVTDSSGVDSALRPNTTAAIYVSTSLGRKRVAGYLGIQNVSWGFEALGSITTGHFNTAIGEGCLVNLTTGSQNHALGQDTMHELIDGNINDAIGQDALYYLLHGIGNVAFGQNAGIIIQGDNNTLLGRQAGSLQTLGNRNILIGFAIQAPNLTGDDQLNIGGIILGDLVTQIVTLPGAISYTGGSFGIFAGTADAADNLTFRFGGGGTLSPTRGAFGYVQGNEAGGEASFGGGAVATGHLVLSINHASAALKINDLSGVLLFGVTNPGSLTLQRTVTAGGTTGAQVINKMAGTVNFAAAATSLVVTNNLVNTSSIIFVQVRTVDATAKTAVVVAGAGSFTITLNAAATAETSVGFWVTN